MQAKEFIFISIAFLLLSFGSVGQDVSFRTYTGSAYYLGDLAPLDSSLSFSKAKPAFGFSVSKQLAKQVSASFRFTQATIEGSDALANEYNRKRRNLSFRSPITEFAFTADVFINEIFPRVNKYGIELYFYTGFTIFRFNPKTYYQGEWIDLQPLGTEGQGIVEFGGIPRYNLTQVGIPLGVGMQFAVSPVISIGFEIAPRLTFSDYLDDVSTDYLDYEKQVELQGELTANIANRIGEFEYGQSYESIVAQGLNPNIKGYVRGDPTDNDWYMFTTATIVYKLFSKKELLKQ